MSSFKLFWKPVAQPSGIQTSSMPKGWACERRCMDIEQKLAECTVCGAIHKCTLHVYMWIGARARLWISSAVTVQAVQ